VQIFVLSRAVDSGRWCRKRGCWISVDMSANTCVMCIPYYATGISTADIMHALASEPLEPLTSCGQTRSNHNHLHSMVAPCCAGKKAKDGLRHCKVGGALPHVRRACKTMTA
jgi:hypothetical protein